MTIKKLAFKILRPFIRLGLQFFFDKRFLQGKYFDSSFIGYRWALISIWQNSILRMSRPQRWPTSSHIMLSSADNIEFYSEDINNFQSPGCYFQNFSAKIVFGKGVYIAPNVGVITANHDLDNIADHMPGQDVVLKDGCWVGMNSVILPGVILGEGTVVGAGSVVTKSFPQGRVVIAGCPAKIIKVISSEI